MRPVAVSARSIRADLPATIGFGQSAALSAVSALPGANNERSSISTPWSTMRKTTACADVVMRSIIDTYFGPNRTAADLKEHQ
jgi:hypothetical protein